MKKTIKMFNSNEKITSFNNSVSTHELGFTNIPRLRSFSSFIVFQKLMVGDPLYYKLKGSFRYYVLFILNFEFFQIKNNF